MRSIGQGSGSECLLFYKSQRKSTLNDILKCHDINYIEKLKNLCEQKVVKTMEKQIIKINEFFTSIIESIKILRKRRFEFEFKKLDKNNVKS